jgi:hypothetical protein
VIAADLDLARQEEIREKLPSLANRVDSAYGWPNNAAPQAKLALRRGIRA